VNISKILENKNIEVHLDLIAGLPGDSLDTFKQSFNKVYALKADMIQLGFLKMIKGSLIRQNANQNGSVYSKYPPYEILMTNDITFNELMQLRKIEYLLDKYYNSKQFKYSLDYVIRMRNINSFDFFEKFSSYLQMTDMFSRKISRIELISVYLEFCRTILDDTEKKLFYDLLKFDYYRFDKKGSIESINFNYSAVHPEFKHEKKNPDWFDSNGRWKVQKPRMEKYCFNPVKLIDEETIELSGYFVLYDFSGNKPAILECLPDYN
jgi:anaerobic magnesium-protoporphyrin IX monomethyl ester cyclase